MLGWGLKYFHFHQKTARKSCGGGGVWNIFYFHHKTTWFTTRFSNAIGKCRFHIILLIKFTTRPQENLVVGVGFGIFSFSPQDRKKILWWGWGFEYFHFHHETKRFTTRFTNAIGKCRIYIILLNNSPQDQEKILW